MAVCTTIFRKLVIIQSFTDKPQITGAGKLGIFFWGFPSGWAIAHENVPKADLTIFKPLSLFVKLNLTIRAHCVREKLPVVDAGFPRN